MSKVSKTQWAKTISDVVHRGRPDIYNYVAKRAITLDEATLHDLPWFWDQKTSCAMGHIAPRYRTNPAQCVDCMRTVKGKKPIYPSTTGEDRTPAIAYVDPAANAQFEWTAAKREQFFTAYVNTCSVPEALKLIGAQMSHLLAIRRDDATFREEMERLEQSDIRQAQFYRAEAAALDNDRMQQLQAQRKFPDSFGAGVRSDLGRAAVGSPEQIDAEFAQILRGIVPARGAEGQIAAPAEGGAGVESDSGLQPDGEGVDSDAGEAGDAPESDDPNSDLV